MDKVDEMDETNMEDNKDDLDLGHCVLIVYFCKNIENMKKILLIILSIIGMNVCANAQSAKYVLVDAEILSSDVVRLQIKTYCTDKRLVEHEVQCAAIRAVLFNGIDVSLYKKALLAEGEQTMIQSYPSYFNNLFATRYSDFIKSYSALSKFKKAGNKSTLYEVEVKILRLRKDLEKNNIKRQLGY